MCVADYNVSSAAIPNNSFVRATYASRAEFQSTPVPTTGRTSIGFVSLVRDDPEALGVRVFVADRAGVDGHVAEGPARQHPDAVALLARVLSSMQDIRQGGQDVELRWEERDALGVELLERLGRVDKASLDDLLAAVRGGKTLLLVPGREARGTRLVEKGDVKLCLETPGMGGVVS